ncbi:MAG TPA: T9SS type A sorting domain-containing protein, partial [Chitinophagaceae bacterium]|nr:T9SS type A sorting domain-containing protein [Chitinophagaceae bacterium]
TTGNRYIDFEMYQTDIYYDRPSRNFYGYGPDMGHTSWQFDAAGNITRPGDIIFTAEYQSSSLTNIEARIWVHISALSITPASFNWTGVYDGAYAGSPYVYAAIRPLDNGTYYTGLQCGNGVWGGPFGIILQDNSLVTNYIARQFVEFSVNLTKLGLDPVTLLGGNACGMPFRRILVKTRASNSFTAELKDFVGPFDFFLAPRADAATETPYICDTGSVAEVHVVNPVATSIYQWSTPDGNIVGTTTGPSIIVDTPGTYIVTQYLQAGCSEYATDTIQVMPFTGGCTVLNNNLYDFRSYYANNKVELDWKVLYNEPVMYFDVERSTDGINFVPIERVERSSSQSNGEAYSYDDLSPYGTTLYYRVKLYSAGNVIRYSSIARIDLRASSRNDITILPNPVREVMQVQISAVKDSKVRVDIFDQSGKLVLSNRSFVNTGNTVLTFDQMGKQPMGIYMVLVSVGDEIFREKVLNIR